MESLPFGFLLWHRVIGNHNALFFRQLSCEPLWVSNSGQRPQGRVFFFFQKCESTKNLKEYSNWAIYKKSLLRHVQTGPVEGFPSLKFLFSNRTMEEIWILPVLITFWVLQVVRGLPDWTTEQQLKSDFAGCGPLKRVSCPSKIHCDENQWWITIRG